MRTFAYPGTIDATRPSPQAEVYRDVNPNRRRFHKLRTILGPIERAVQANVALVIAQAMVIRLSLEMQNTSAEEPDVLVLLGFLLVCGIAVGIAVVLYREVRSFPHQGMRIVGALGSLAVQAAAFQLLFEFAT